MISVGISTCCIISIRWSLKTRCANKKWKLSTCMFILMVILKHILWFSLPSECLTAGYLLSILYSLNGCEGILSYSLHKYTKITNGKRIHVYIMLFNLFLYVTIALSILYSLSFTIHITPLYFIICNITKFYIFFQFWFNLLIHCGNKTYRLDLLRIVPGTQINIPNRLCSVEFLSLYHNINIHKHIWSKEYLFRNTVVTCKKRKYKFSKKPFPILSG